MPKKRQRKNLQGVYHKMKKRFVKIISLILAVSVIFGSAAVMSSAAMDGYVLSVADARKVLRDAVGLEKLSDADRKIADMDFDSEISVADARTVLRLAVQLDIIDGKTYENEYEMLSGGQYTATLAYTADNEAGVRETHTFKLAVTPYSFKMDVGDLMSMFEKEFGGSDSGLDQMFEMFKISAILFTGGKISLIDDENKQSLTVSEKEFGGDFSDVKNIMTEVIPDLHSSLSGASSKKSVTLDGKECTVYVFDETAENGARYTTNVYMNGKKLVKIDYADKSGEVFSSVVFEALSRVVNVSDTNVKSYDDTSMADLGGLFG